MYILYIIMILYSDNFLEIRSNLNVFCMVIIIIKI